MTLENNLQVTTHKLAYMRNSCMYVCMHMDTHTYIHTYVVSSSNWQHQRTDRTLDSLRTVLEYFNQVCVLHRFCIQRITKRKEICKRNV